MSPTSKMPLIFEYIDPQWAKVPAAIVLIIIFSSLFRSDPLFSGFPVVGLASKSKDFQFWKTKQKYAHDAVGVLDEGLQKGGGPFQVITPLGPKIILPNKYADEVRSNPHLSFARQISKEFLSHLSGYESFHTLFGSVLVETIKSKLTQSLNYIIGDLSDETAAALQERLGESQEWRTINVSQESLELVARLSTLVFIGPELSRNREWLDIVGSYSINVMIAVHKLRLFPAFLRRVANIFLPEGQACRKAIRDARRLIDPVVAKRREERRSQSKDGKLPKSTDTIGWMDDVAKGKPYDFPLHQLFLSGAAIHTTSNFLGTAILDICSYPEYVEPLRAEIRVAIRENGWTKAALQKLKLMDSFLKESQRLSPASIVSITRNSDAKLELSDGTILPKGAPISVATDRMRDPTVYADPQKFDGNRFFKKRQIPGQENNWQLVTATADHLGFGLGTHSCPGRFFAANEAKVAFSYLLIHYDFRFLPGQNRPERLVHSESTGVNPLAQIECRRTGESLSE